MAKTKILNRTCKACGTDYTDPGGRVGDPKRYCPNCGSKAWFAGPDISVKPLSEQTPQQIDEQLYPLWIEAARYTEFLNHTNKYLKRDEEKQAAGKFMLQRSIDEARERVAAYQAKLDEIKVQIEPFDTEYDDRGGWTRYLLVTNRGGHLHRMAADGYRYVCHTLRPGRTRVFLLAESSGMANAEVVERYSFTACSKCFPEAPVEPREALSPDVCPGSRTYDYEPVRRGMAVSNNGKCNHCGQVITVSDRGYGKLRKHDTPLAS
jgi:hypothetical protein